MSFWVAVGKVFDLDSGGWGAGSKTVAEMG